MTNTDIIFELADNRNIDAADMLSSFDTIDIELGNAIRAAAGVDVITDSVIDELIADLDGEI